MLRGQLHALAALPPGKSPWYILDIKLDRQQNQSGYGGKGNIPLLEIEPQLSTY